MAFLVTNSLNSMFGASNKLVKYVFKICVLADGTTGSRMAFCRPRTHKNPSFRPIKDVQKV